MRRWKFGERPPYVEHDVVVDGQLVERDHEGKELGRRRYLDYPIALVRGADMTRAMVVSPAGACAACGDEDARLVFSFAPEVFAVYLRDAESHGEQVYCWRNPDRPFPFGLTELERRLSKPWTVAFERFTQ